MTPTKNTDKTNKKDSKPKKAASSSKSKVETAKSGTKTGSRTTKTSGAKETKSATARAKSAGASKGRVRKSTGSATKRKTTAKQKTETTSKAGKKKPRTEAGKSAKTKAKESRFWDETMENLAESASVLSEEAKKFSIQVSSYSEEVFGKIKTTTSDALKYGQDLTKSAVDKAQKMGEKLKDNYLVARLNSEKKHLSSQLGMKLYLVIKANKNKVPEDILKENKEIAGLLKQIEEIDKKILELANDEKSEK